MIVLTIVENIVTVLPVIVIQNSYKYSLGNITIVDTIEAQNYSNKASRAANRENHSRNNRDC